MYNTGFNTSEIPILLCIIECVMYARRADDNDIHPRSSNVAVDSRAEVGSRIPGRTTKFSSSASFLAQWLKS